MAINTVNPEQTFLFERHNMSFPESSDLIKVNIDPIYFLSTRSQAYCEQFTGACHSKRGKCLSL